MLAIPLPPTRYRKGKPAPLGLYPEELKAARSKWDQARALLAENIDLSHARQMEKQAARHTAEALYPTAFNIPGPRYQHSAPNLLPQALNGKENRGHHHGDGKPRHQLGIELNP